MDTFKLRFASHLGVRSRTEPLFAATLGTQDAVAHIEYAAQLGFAGIEDNCLLDRSVEEQSKIGNALSRFGLEMGCFCSGLDLQRRFWVRSDDAADAAVDAEIKVAIAAARRVNGRYIVLAPPRDPTVPLAYQQAALVRHLRRVERLLEKAGVLLCLEQTCATRVPVMLLEHIAEASAVVEAANSPAVKLLFDFFHVQSADGNLLYHLDRTWKNIAVMQIADVPGRGDLGHGEINWLNVLRHVSARGYHGLIEYEIFPRLQGAAGEAAALQSLRSINAAL